MVLGTGSSVGKSLIATALCRSIARRGWRVAPFKAQNMSLNSAATPDGREIGRAQALQAEAAGVACTTDMNPVLIKPFGPNRSQAVVNGVIWGELTARDFMGATKASLWPEVTAAYDRLAEAYEVVVIEGAGSPAEINLRPHDIVNMSVAHYADARALLVADIDRGGAFAAVAGTHALLDERDRSRLAGYAFNKFRGDASLLAPGIDILSERLAIPCLGIVPYLDATGIDEEDGVTLEERRRRTRPWSAERLLRIAVIAYPHISNFTDFDALDEEPSVDLRFVDNACGVDGADVVILPGSKSTLADLAWIRSRRFDVAIAERVRDGAIVAGICGGMQMLGERVDDPHAVEGGGSAAGLQLLALRTELGATKITVPVRATTRAFGAPCEFSGYEIHVGRSDLDETAASFCMLTRAGEHDERLDGARSADGNIFASYIHGAFASDALRHAFIRWAYDRRRLVKNAVLKPVAALRDQRIDTLAWTVENHLDVDALLAVDPLPV